MIPARDYDYIMVGGGLQSGLLALALRYRQPDCRVLLIERHSECGGNHTWCCHARDIPVHAEDWIKPLVTHSWPGYDVQFPGLRRYVDQPYRCVTSAHFREVVTSHEQQTSSDGSRLLQVLYSTPVSVVRAHAVLTTDGREFRGRVVIDCRGRSLDSLPASGFGYQKFVGLEIESDRPWPTTTPMLMDACTAQTDGFRFLYVLPFSDHRVLIEDTCFSDQPHIDHDRFIERIGCHIRSRGVGAWRVLRTESGCLPMPFTDACLPHASTPLVAGYAGGWFHAATGYSFPLAVRVAETIASATAQNAAKAMQNLAASHQRRAKFARFLNRLLFRLVRPGNRWQIFERLYRVLPQDAISRFYAHEFTARDAARMIVGWPPSGLTPLRFLNLHKRADSCLSTSS